MKLEKIRGWDEYFTHVAGIANGVSGTFVEMGFGKGESANRFVKLMNAGTIDKRDIYLMDSFEGFPPPTVEDTPGKAAAGQWRVPMKPALAIKNKIDVKVEVVKGFFEKTAPEYSGGAIAILHLDCDLYSSYISCLSALYDKVVPGGVILFDEYISPIQKRNFPGAYIAIDEFFADKDSAIEGFEFHNSSTQKYFMIKKD